MIANDWISSPKSHAMNPFEVLKGGCNGDGDINATSCSEGDYSISLAFAIKSLGSSKTNLSDGRE